MNNVDLTSTQADTNVSVTGTAPANSASARAKSTAATATTTARTAATKAPRTLLAFTIVADPDRLLTDAVSRVKNTALQEFLTSVMHEPEIYQALTSATFVPMNASAQPSTHPGSAIRRNQPSAPDHSYPIQALRRAGEMAAYWCACGAEERDVLFVATLLQGAQRLLAAVVQGDSTIEDVMFTLVRRSLHRLDDHTPRCSRLLRLALGWGCADEIDDFYVPRLQIAVQRALTQIVFGSHTSASSSRSHDPSPWLCSIKDTEQCQA